MTCWNWTRKEWQTLLIRTAWVNAFCLGLALVVAMEFYLGASIGPVEITWREAAEAALHDWFPWMLMSPVIVALAAMFPFDRKRWRRNLLVHLAACLAVVIVDERLLTATFRPPRQWILRAAFGGPPGGGPLTVVDGFGRGPGQVMPGGPRGFGGALRPPTDGAAAGQGGISFRAVGQSNGPWVPGSNGMASLGPGTIPPPGIAAGRPMFLPMTNSWGNALHRALFRFQFAAPIYWCVVCGCWVMSHLQETRERERRSLELEARLTQANLQALKMQLQPHFLFNALNAVSSLIHDNPKAADDVVGALSQFLRMSLEVSSQNEVPLPKELEFVNRYLDIQQARFGDRLRIRREIDPDAADAAVPPLLLQPLVENSIRHGIEARESGGVVTIRIQRLGQMLRLEVCDDGGGFNGRQLLAAGQGIGLSNTKARLQALYGERHQFRLTANSPTGACATIEIPFRSIEGAAGFEP